MFYFLFFSDAKATPSPRARARTSPHKTIRLANKVAALKHSCDLRDKITAAKSSIAMAIQSGLFVLNTTNKSEELMKAISAVKAQLSDLERESAQMVTKIGVLQNLNNEANK